MPAPNERAGVFWYAFLHNTSRRSTVTRIPNAVRHRDLKYGAWRGRITSAIARATPSALDGHANRVEGGTALHAHITEAPPRSRWAFGPCDRQPDMPTLDQHDALRLPFAQRTDTNQHQPLGADLIAVGQPKLRDRPRAIGEERHSDAALPRCTNRE